MIDNREEFEALNETVNSAGWAIFKRITHDEISKHFKNAKNTDNKDVAFVELQKYKVIETILQKPYHVLNESEYKQEGDK